MQVLGTALMHTNRERAFSDHPKDQILPGVDSFALVCISG